MSARAFHCIVGLSVPMSVYDDIGACAVNSSHVSAALFTSLLRRGRRGSPCVSLHSRVLNVPMSDFDNIGARVVDASR